MFTETEVTLILLLAYGTGVATGYLQAWINHGRTLSDR